MLVIENYDISIHIFDIDIMKVEEKRESKFDFMNEPIPEDGIFKDKKISDLPQYLRRVYQFKKMLYSHH